MMVEADYTPGPWFRETNEFWGDGYIRSEVGHIAYLRSDFDDETFPQRDANARLIAAAPEMVELLSDIDDLAQGRSIYLGDGDRLAKKTQELLRRIREVPA